MSEIVLLAVAAMPVVALVLIEFAVRRVRAWRKRAYHRRLRERYPSGE